jgi:hypothetical protein
MIVSHSEGVDSLIENVVHQTHVSPFPRKPVVCGGKEVMVCCYVAFLLSYPQLRRDF